MQRVPMTVEGAEALRKELDNLKNVVRPRITGVRRRSSFPISRPSASWGSTDTHS